MQDAHAHDQHARQERAAVRDIQRRVALLTRRERHVGTLVGHVLLPVTDGMNHAVFRELSEDLRSRGWIQLSNHPGLPLLLLVSAIPSVTETSRASLLASKVVHADSASEKRSFATHPDLVSVSRVAHPPLLFHEGELVERRDEGREQWLM